MIQITRGSNNTVIMTLTEKVSATYPYFLIRFVSEVGNTENSCIVTDSSSYPSRYNKFTIAEDTAEDRVMGRLMLTEGQWVYYAYGQTSSSNLSYTNADSDVLETGIVKVAGTATDTFTQPSYTDTFTWKS